MQILTIKNKKLPFIYKFLKEANYPKLGNNYQLFYDYYSQDCKHFICYKKTNGSNLETIIWFAVKKINQRIFIDLAVNKKWQKKWANKKILQDICSIIFQNAAIIYMNVTSLTSHRFCKKLGCLEIGHNLFCFYPETIKKFLRYL